MVFNRIQQPTQFRNARRFEPYACSLVANAGNLWFAQGFEGFPLTMPSFLFAHPVRPRETRKHCVLQGFCKVFPKFGKPGVFQVLPGLPGLENIAFCKDFPHQKTLHYQGFPDL